jgi:EAL domain-containing protein (putative c-di-GMP-specific phosphodiesterase class I)
LGQLLKVPELAEGVEADAQLAWFAAEGCNEVLGYLIGDRSRLFASTCHEWLECPVSRTC